VHILVAVAAVVVVALVGVVAVAVPVAVAVADAITQGVVFLVELAVASGQVALTGQTFLGMNVAVAHWLVTPLVAAVAVYSRAQAAQAQAHPLSLEVVQPVVKVVPTTSTVEVSLVLLVVAQTLRVQVELPADSHPVVVVVAGEQAAVQAAHGQEVVPQRAARQSHLTERPLLGLQEIQHEFMGAWHDVFGCRPLFG
jgi:hypothetical protein